MALCEKILPVLIFILISLRVTASDGFPEKVVVIESKEKGAILKALSCFPVTVWVNEKDFELNPGVEVSLGSSSWSRYPWFPGKMGPMRAKTLEHPLSSKMAPTFGADAGGTHLGNNRFSYDFAIPEGTPVLAMEGGVVIRIVQHFIEAHRDLKRLDEVNRVFILHQDGSVASYVHLKPGSASVKLCEKIVARQRIALSGHNGYSNGPHLHVDVFRPISGGKSHTIPLVFLP